jgi:fructose-1,6-bisphosphatase/inositol monophosphatase family enzyme
VECGRARAFDRLMRLHPRVRGYTDCLGHTLAAEGAVGAMVDYGLKRWDLAATQVLIEEAGGRYECLYRSRRNGQELFGIVCGKPRVVAWVRRLFR